MAGTSTAQRIPHWTHLPLVGLLYALIILPATMPALSDLRTRLIGNNIDNWIFYWNDWWMRTAIAQGHSWFETPYLFHPEGTTLVTHSNTFLHGLLALVVEPLLGPVGAYNVVFLLELWLGAVGMFLLVRTLTGRSLPAFLSGFIFTFAPYHLSQALAHANLGAIHWWPFYALMLHHVLTGRRRLAALGAGLFAALTLWSGLHLGVLLALWSVPYVLWHLVRHRDTRTWTTAGRLAIVGVVTLLLSIPVLLPLLRDWSLLTTATAGFDESLTKQTDLLAYWVPPTYHPLWGASMVEIYERFVVNRAFTPYLGYATLALALLALRHRQRNAAAIWGLMGGLWLILAAGSAPRVFGHVFESIPLPYSLIRDLFPLSAIRSPDRYNLLLVFSLAVLAGMGAARLWNQKKRRWLLLPLSLLVVVEYLAVPLPMWEVPPDSPALTRLANEADGGAVVHYPMGYSASKLWLYYQTRHGRPMVEGHLSRYTADTYDFVARQPLLRALYQEADGIPGALPPPMLGAAEAPPLHLGPDLRDLLAHDVRYILLHTPYADDVQVRHFRETAPLLPIHKDAALTVYDLRTPRPWHYGPLPAEIATGAALLQARTAWEGEDRVELTFLTRLTGEWTAASLCAVVLNGADGDSPVAETGVTFFPAGAQWQANDLDVRRAVVTLPANLSPGDYPLAVGCGDGSRQLAEFVRVTAEEKKLLLRRPLALTYEEQIALAGYRWWTEESQLHLALPWRAMQEVEASYKVFVHLLNDAGEIVSQYDAVPCSWECPTSAWEAGAWYVDEAVLPLWGLPPGEYRLALGLYDAVTGRRLPTLADGAPVADGYFLLPDSFTIRHTAEQNGNSP